MAAIGIDLGQQTCYVAVARQGGIETVANECSERCTPTCVSMGEKLRCVGAAAKNQLITNHQNTIWGWKKLVGKKFRDPIVQNELKHLPYEVVEGPRGSVGIKVNYLNRQQVFSPTHLTAMMLTKLKETAEIALKTKVVDCVISVPSYFSNAERHAMLDAASICGLNVMRLMNDTTATALSYGIYKQDLPAPEEKPRNVVFLDIGHSDLQLAVCAFNKGKLKILATTADSHLGGSSFDQLLANYFVEDFHKRYRIDASRNPRAYLRLLQECERLKKLMSANSQDIPINIECFMEEKDVSGMMSRDVMEKLADELFRRIEFQLRRVLVCAKARPEDICAVEVVGGSCRIPAIKEIIRRVFNREASTTLNGDEAVARGCALQCAILSPNFRVRDFSITDVQPYSIVLNWQGVMDDDPSSNSMEVFNQFHPIPYTKMLTFYRSEPFQLEAVYNSTDSALLNPEIGKFQVNKVAPRQDGQSSKVKVKVEVDIHGLFGVSASMIEATETAEQPSNGDDRKNDEKSRVTHQGASTTDNCTESPDSKDRMQDDLAANDDTKAASVKKAHVAAIDLPVVAVIPRLSKDEVRALAQMESQMIEQDRQEKERMDSKNAVEEYVYEMRDKLSTELEPFIKEADKLTFLHLLEDTENWLYDKGEDQQKEVYSSRLKNLKALGDPVVSRAREHTSRSREFDYLVHCIQVVMKVLEDYENKDEKFSHIAVEDMEKVHKAMKSAREWFDQKYPLCGQQSTYEDPLVLCREIREQAESLRLICEPIVTKPKPAVEVPKNDPKAANGDEANTGDENRTQERVDDETSDKDAKSVDMELD